MKIYIASSIHNVIQPRLVNELRKLNYKVYDFKEHLFIWPDSSDVLAKEAFNRDFSAMLESDICILVMPCGRSAHLEAGYFVGANKILYILKSDSDGPELMYNMAHRIFNNFDALINFFKSTHI